MVHSFNINDPRSLESEYIKEILESTLNYIVGCRFHWILVMHDIWKILKTSMDKTLHWSMAEWLADWLIDCFIAWLIYLLTLKESGNVDGKHNSKNSRQKIITLVHCNFKRRWAYIVKWFCLFWSPTHLFVSWWWLEQMEPMEYLY